MRKETGASRLIRTVSIILPLFLLCAVSCRDLSPTDLPGSYGDSSAPGSSGGSGDGYSYGSSLEESSEEVSSEEPDSESSSSLELSGVSSEAEPTPDIRLYRYVTDTSANLRTEASSGSDIIKKLVYGTKLRYLSTEGSWTRVVTLDEECGYVFTALLSMNEPEPEDPAQTDPRTLQKWPEEYTVSGFYDAMTESYAGKSTGPGYLPLKGITVILDPGHGGRDGGAVYTSGSGKMVTEKKINLDIALIVAAELENMGADVVLTRSTDIYLGLYARAAIINMTVLRKHREILSAQGLDTVYTDSLIASMQSVIDQNSDSESGSSRGIMKGLGACPDLRTLFDISAEHKDIIVVSLHCNSVAGASYVNGLEVYYGTNDKIYSVENKLLPNELKTNPLNPSYQMYDDASRRRFASVLRDLLESETEFELRGNQGLYQANFCVLREANLVSALVEMGYLSNSGDRAFLTDPAGQKRISYAIASGIYRYFCVPDEG